MNHSESIKTLALALVAVQKELKSIGKDSVNPHFKNRYASLETITETIRPILARNGFSVIQGGGNSISDEAGFVRSLSVETMLLHSSGEWISNTVAMPLDKTNAQGAGSALTYGRRYGLSSILALTTDEDDDGHEASKPPAKASAAQIAKIRELAKVTGDEAKVEPLLNGLTQEKAGEIMARLTSKADQKTANV